jgi:hypothetical protein
MLKGMSCNTLPDTAPVAYGTDTSRQTRVEYFFTGLKHLSDIISMVQGKIEKLLPKLPCEWECWLSYEKQLIAANRNAPNPLRQREDLQARV